MFGGAVSGYLMTHMQEQAHIELAFGGDVSGSLSCDDPTLLTRIITKLEELAQNKCQDLPSDIRPRDIQYVTFRWENWGYPSNPCGFMITHQITPFTCQ